MMHNNFNPFGDVPEMPTQQPDNLTDEERMQLATATLLGGCATTAAACGSTFCQISLFCLLFCCYLISPHSANFSKDPPQSVSR